MEKLEKCVRSNKRRLYVLMLVSVLGMVAFGVLAQGYVENMKNNSSIPNITTVPTMVEIIETSPVLFLAPIPESSDMSSLPIPEAIPAETIYSKPTNVPSLREYEINKDSHVEIWHARNPESYIMPNNEWVKYIASLLYIDNDGRIKYKNKPIPHTVDYNGNIVLWTDEPFFNNYVSDDELFNFSANADMWQNADYYLYHGLNGDCEDWAIALTSMMLSGEMSIKENGTYIRQVIRAKAVIGNSGNSKDVWIEYNIYDNRYISSTGTEFNPGIGKYQSITTFHPESEWRDNFKPIYQFTNMNFGKYGNN